MTTSSRSLGNDLKEETRTSEKTKNEAVFQELQNPKVTPHGLQPPTRFCDYEENVTVEEPPPKPNRGLGPSGALPVYTLDWTSRTDSYFMPMTGLDFLIGVSEVLLFQTTDNLKSSDSSFVVKIPNGETLYLGTENSTSMQRALFCSQRSFNMAFLDPNKQLAVTFIRKGALTNFETFFKQKIKMWHDPEHLLEKSFGGGNPLLHDGELQELVVLTAESNTPLGRIQQNNSLSTVSFTILDDRSKQIYKLVTCESTVLRRINRDVHFSILDPVERTGGVILHKWDNNRRDFVYHITFPSRDTSTQHKMLLIGVALLVEYTYFEATRCFCFS